MVIIAMMAIIDVKRFIYTSNSFRSSPPDRCQCRRRNNPSDNTSIVDVVGASKAETAIDAAMDSNNDSDDIAAALSSSGGMTNNGVEQMNGGAPDPPTATTDVAAIVVEGDDDDDERRRGAMTTLG
jgi:hypothetical protein